MKFLKKFIAVFVVLTAVFTVVACGKEDSSDEDVISDVSLELLSDVDKLNVTDDLEFPSKIDGVVITWSSSNEAVVSNEGKVTRGENDELVTLTVTLKKGTVEKTFEIKVKVLKAEKEVQEVDLSQYGTVVSCKEANEIGAKLEADATSEELYVVKGVIVEVVNTQYGNLYISDDNGATKFYLYGLFDLSGNRYDAMSPQPKVGDTVAAYGKLVNYKGNTVEIKNSTMVLFNAADEEKPGETPTVKPDANKPLTVTEAIAVAKQAGDGGTTEEYYVKGDVVRVSNPTYGEMYITDGVNEIYVYGATAMDGTYFNKLEDKPYAGDSVVLLGVLKTFNDSPEMGRSKIVEFTHNEVEFNDQDYEVSTIANARDAEVGKKLKVTGVVAAITYADGMVPNGFYLVDQTGSIYVYGDQVAQRISKGNTITICGEKTYYVLGSEISFAEKFGYKGCCQLQNPHLMENDNGNTEFNKEWITETTIKEIVETSVKDNITTNIYKVNGLIRKENGSGFVNYYIEDLDGETGSYTYTACSGSDFAWLDQYDGKICTVYLSAHNCKSTNTDCFFRFIPIEVVDEGYEFNTDNTGEFVVKYYGVDQFKANYNNDPALKLVTSVSSELLGFNDAKLSYTSSDTNVIYFAEEDGETVMHTKNIGIAIITVKGEYNGKSFEQIVEVEVTKAAEVNAITVKEAIDSADGTVVAVKGVVVSSLVNRTGFYLSDETGIISVVCEASMFDEIKIGNLIVVEGTRIHNKKDPAASHAGQTVINDAKLIINYYGEHEYCKTYFDTTKTIKDIAAYDVTVDYSTSVFVVDALIEVEETNFYTNLHVKSTDGEVSMRLYSSSAAKQYKWLCEYNGKVVKLEIALCNWNDKTYYTGCVISATYNGETVINSLNFNN